MGIPVITTVTSNQRYVVADSGRVHAILTVSNFVGQMDVLFAAAGPAPTLSLHRGGAMLALPLPAVGGSSAGTLSDGSTAWDVGWTLADEPAPPPPLVGAHRRVTITISDPSFVMPSAAFTLKVHAATELPTVDVTATTGTLGDIEADPTMTLLSPPTQSVVELQPAIALQARAFRTIVASVSPAPCAGISVVWSQTDGPSLTWTNPAQSSDGTGCRRDISITAPAVGGGSTMTFAYTATAGEFSNSIAASVAVTPRTRRTILVLDRSGSMSGARWTNAVRAAHIWMDIVAGIRRGVNASDRIGILVFDDLQSGFRVGSPSDRIKVVAPAVGALAALPDPPPATLTLEPPGRMTPIGDGLRVGLDELLEGLDPATAPSVFYSLVLLTDGYENSGTIRVDPDTPPKGVGQLFDTIKRQGARAAFNFGDDPTLTTPKNIRVYPIGVGPGSVQEDVLDDLAYGDVPQPPGFYRLTTSIEDLAAGFAQIGAHDYGGAALVSNSGPDPVFGPDAGVTDATYVSVNAGEHKLVVVMLKKTAAEVMEITKRAVGGSFEAVPVGALTTWVRDAHVTAVIDLSVGGLATAASEWRVRRTGGVDPLTPTQVIAVRDLSLLTDIAFDRTRYRSGQPMTIMTRIRSNGRPVTGATVRVELAMPGESLGTTLAQGSKLLPSGGAGFLTAVPVVSTTVSTHGGAAGGGTTGTVADPLHPKPAMLQAILKARQMSEFPIESPPAVFPDGTDRLHDDGAHADGGAGDGDYANTFTRTTREGTYTFRFTITGSLPDGSPFADTLTMSRWVGLEIDPLECIIDMRPVGIANRALRAVDVFVTPISRAGEYLGPFRGSAIVYRTSAGAFVGDLVTHPDGRYSQRLEYAAGSAPIVTITIDGKRLPPAAVAPGCLAMPINLVREIIRRIVKLFKP